MFAVELYSRKIFLYVFFVRKYFHNEIKANYGITKPVMLGSASVMRSLGSTSGTPPTLVLTTCRLRGDIIGHKVSQR